VADAVLLGALGLPDVLHRDGTEAGPDLQFRLRFDLDLYAGVRPIDRFPGVPGPLSTQNPFGFTIIRENTEGLYASRGGGAAVSDKVSTDTLIVTAAGTDRIARFAFEYALAHPPLSGAPTVTCVDKANVLRSYAFFRSRFEAAAAEYAGRVAANRFYVDAFCAQMVLDPTSIHVAVAENMFGDIVSDLAAGMIGGLGVAPGANIGDEYAVFEATHGSAPKYKGQNKINPTALMLSGVMMLRHLDETEAADRLENAIADVIREGENVTYDLKPSRDDPSAVGTSEYADAIVEKMGS
jgi:3-isopropylmalate dehydrogenase